MVCLSTQQNTVCVCHAKQTQQNKSLQFTSGNSKHFFVSVLAHRKTFGYSRLNFSMLFLEISSNMIFCLDSSLNGFDLVAAKVKRVVWQGGWYPPTHSWGVPSYNWDCGQGHYDTTGCNGASQHAVNNMPPNVDMVYSVIGRYVISGNECIQRICS